MIFTCGKKNICGQHAQNCHRSAVLSDPLRNMRADPLRYIFIFPNHMNARELLLWILCLEDAGNDPGSHPVHVSVFYPLSIDLANIIMHMTRLPPGDLTISKSLCQNIAAVSP